MAGQLVLISSCWPIGVKSPAEIPPVRFRFSPMPSSFLLLFSFFAYKDDSFHRANIIFRAFFGRFPLAR